MYIYIYIYIYIYKGNHCIYNYMHTHNGDLFSIFANLMPVHVHNLQTYDNLVSMHIIIYKEIKLFLFSSMFYLYTILIVQNVIFCTCKSKFVPLNDISQIEERL